MWLFSLNISLNPLQRTQNSNPQYSSVRATEKAHLRENICKGERNWMLCTHTQDTSIQFWKECIGETQLQPSMNTANIMKRMLNSLSVYCVYIEMLRKETLKAVTNYWPDFSPPMQIPFPQHHSSFPLPHALYPSVTFKEIKFLEQEFCNDSQWMPNYSKHSGISTHYLFSFL